MKATVVALETLNLVDTQGAVRRQSIDVEVFEKSIGRRLITDMPFDLASQLKVGMPIEVNGIDMNLIEPTGRD